MQSRLNQLRIHFLDGLGVDARHQVKLLHQGHLLPSWEIAAVVLGADVNFLTSCYNRFPIFLIFHNVSVTISIIIWALRFDFDLDLAADLSHIVICFVSIVLSHLPLLQIISFPLSSTTL